LDQSFLRKDEREPPRVHEAVENVKRGYSMEKSERDAPEGMYIGPAGEQADGVMPFGDLAPGSSGNPLADYEMIDGETFLRGARFASGIPAYPKRPLCPETGHPEQVEELFGPRGTLYSYSIVHVSSTRDVPYAIGYVDFPSSLRVLAIIRIPAGHTLACDCTVVLQSDGERWWVEPEGQA